VQTLELVEIAEKAVNTAKKMGIEQAEAYVQDAKSLTIEVSKQQVEDLKFSNKRGIGVRVIKQGKMGFAYTTDLSLEGIENVVKESIIVLNYSTEDEYNTMPGVIQDYLDLDLYDDSIQLISLEKKIDLAKQIEIAALEYDRRIKKTEKSVYQDAELEVALVNSLGIHAHYKSNYCGGYAWLIAEQDGDVQSGTGMNFTKKLEDLNPKNIGLEAAQKAVRMLNAKSVKTKRVPLIFDSYVVTNFLDLFASAVNAESVQKGKSLLSGKLGQKIVSEQITIIDDGLMPNGLATSIIDGEGVVPSKTVVIDKGRLISFLHNTYTAAKDGTKSTGNAVRGGFITTPEVGTTNFYLAEGTKNQEEIIQSINEGFYVTEIMGMHTANPISGDFSLGASGLWISKGEFSYPVRGVAIAGNVLELFNSVESIGNDLRFFGSIGAPTVLFGKVTVSGK
jgi:PmbA protein